MEREEKGWTYSKEEVANIMCNINRQSYIRKVKSITQPNQRQRHDVMSHQFLEIFPWLLQLQTQYYGLLCPIARLKQIVRFERALMAPMREVGEHTLCLKVPHRCPRHYVKPQWAQNREIHGCVDLFHEAILLSARSDAVGDCHRPNEALHEKFAREGQNDDVEGHEGKIASAFAIIYWSIGACSSMGWNMGM